ncbi:MAG: M24 family metallopeptidase [Bryobacteraceae bacterium]
MLTPQGCARRRERLLTEMQANGWDLFLTGNYRTAYYFTGVLAPSESPVLFLQWPDGSHCLLQTETYSPDRCVTHPFHDLGLKLAEVLRSNPPRNPGMEGPGALAMHALLLNGYSDATTAVLEMRRTKEPDEIDEIRASLALCRVAYDAARATIQPGVTELDVYLAMHAAIQKTAGAVVPFPGDFACGKRCIRGGGPPTTRVLEQGDLYILDLFPAPALYFGDTCRTFAVGGEPTGTQRRAWELVMEARSMAEHLVRPGVPARSVHARVQQFLDVHPVTRGSFWHHLGHGIGHHGHEAPRIMPPSDDVFREGDVITLEPGVYGEALQGGIRLEDNYIVREGGLENLFDYPLEL